MGCCHQPKTYDSIKKKKERRKGNPWYQPVGPKASLVLPKIGNKKPKEKKRRGEEVIYFVI